jgi:hypothetical protein
VAVGQSAVFFRFFEGTFDSIRWIQERKGLWSRNGVEGIPLDGRDAVGAGNPRTLSVELDSIAPDLCVAGDQMKRSSLSNARVDHRSRIWKRKQRSKLHSLSLG